MITQKKKIAVITGASSGMGKEFVGQVQKFFPKLSEIWVIARREDRLLELRKAFGEKIRPLALDLTDDKDLQSLQEAFEAEDPNIRVLINAAGNGFIGDIMELPVTDLTSTIDLNVRTLTEVTCIALPYIGNEGRIINLASASAFIPQPGFAVYAASKSYVLSFSRALGKEVAKRDISVTAVCPGPVKTEFFKVAERHQKMAERKKKYMSDPRKVVRAAMQDALKRRDVSVYSFSMKAVRLITKILPHRLILTFWGA